MQIVAENLGVERLGRPVFSGVDFCLKAQSVMAVRGANGSGKSSLLRLIAGLLPASSGQLIWRTEEAVLSGLDIGRRAHFCAHQDALKPGLSIKETMQFFKALTRTSDADANSGRGADWEARDVLVALGLDQLDPAGPVKFLSAGQRRRLALSRLLLSWRPLWLLDEPMTSLDARGQDIVLRLLAAHASAGGIVIMTTHESDVPPSTEWLDIDRHSAPAVVRAI